MRSRFYGALFVPGTAEENHSAKTEVVRAPYGRSIRRGIRDRYVGRVGCSEDPQDLLAGFRVQ